MVPYCRLTRFKFEMEERTSKDWRGTALDVEAPHTVDPMILPVYALIFSFDVIVAVLIPTSRPCRLPPIEAADEAVRCS
jgi:hypothetical protein